MVELSQTLWHDYIFSMWCTQPWVVHAHMDAKRDGGQRASKESELPLEQTASRALRSEPQQRHERAELSRLPG